MIPTLEELHRFAWLQQPEYPDASVAAETYAHLHTLPPLVFAGECDDLRNQLSQVSAGKAFLLQGGDCAETFAGIKAGPIMATLRVLLSMSVVLTYAAQLPIIKVGRMAGQYGKPRSSNNETRGDVTLPAYRGDAVNGFEFTSEARAHDPKRLVDMYAASSATLNLVRAFAKGGFADLRQIHAWNATFVRDSPVEAKYEQLSAEIERALGFMEACGVPSETMRTVDFYSSHEALLLAYEQAMTRIDSRTQAPYDTSGHLVWVGERTRALDTAHIELLRHVRNPLGIKLGPTTSGSDALALAERLDPSQVPGRITFISRMGAEKVRDVLPPIVEAVEASGRQVAWVCDPMHGNTFETATGYKTRSYDAVVDELDGFFDVHEALGTWPGGVHIELTGEAVTECLGGASHVSVADLEEHYETTCDPRLNRNQSLELAFMIAERLNVSSAARRGATVPDDWDLG
ncbi:MAG: 3-deoxy-7-phosphoheptulonate synthase class II [Propionibacteriaceae bacterium]|jgi:3-deoxy-7-phosphoheptulonate synthase|nr:3-deoxy-7-phosphoheptulonate synthase class II [Propionibacteriaceae bacterium]